MSAMLPLHDEIERDGEILDRVVEYLSVRVPLSGWRPDVRGSLRLALSGEALGRVEAAKSESLRRRIFGVMPTPDLGDDPGDACAADRLRADLRDILPFCAGDYLVDYDAAARACMAGSEGTGP